MFHREHEVRAAAREQYKKYIDKVMSSKFAKRGFEVFHNCEQTAAVQRSNDATEVNDELEHSSSCDNTRMMADELFYDYEQEHPNVTQQLQRICNTWSKHQKNDISGHILTCRNCQALFSTNEIVDMSLYNHQ